MSTTTTTAPIEVTTQPPGTYPWIEGQGECFLVYAQLSDAQLEAAAAAIAEGLARNGRPGDELLTDDFGTRVRAKAGALYLWFKTPGSLGYGFAPIADAIDLLLDPDRSPEEQHARKQRIDEIKARKAMAEHEAGMRREQERLEKKRADAEEMERRLARWNARSKFEQACLLLSVYAPQHAEVGEALIVVAAIQEQLPDHWEGPPPCDVDIVGRSPAFQIELQDRAREGMVLLRNKSNAARSLPEGIEIPRGAVREVPKALLDLVAVKNAIASGHLMVVAQAPFVIREQE